jgi:hypothetical protein
MKRTPIKITWSALIISIVIIFLVSYTVYDASFTKPSVNEKIEYVNNEFDSLKIYLDVKIPEIDEALIKHEMQIKRQEEQLIRLHKLTESIREE